jgi:hypothetical protein
MAETDLLGPGSNTPNVALTRPADDRVFSVGDTWYKDCSSLLAQDGTAWKSAANNGYLAQFRALIRGNGQTIAGADIIPTNNANDSMMLQSVQNLIQRGLPRFGVDTGAVNALVVALSPGLQEYKAGTSIKVLVLNTNTGAAQINVNGLGERNITRQDLSALQQGDLLAGSVVTLDDDGTEFQLLMPASFSNGARIVTSSATLTLTGQDHAIALQRTTSVAAMNILLPPGLKNGHTIEIEDVVGNLVGSTPATVIPDAGDTGGITGETAGYVMNRNFQSTKFRLYVSGSTRIWSRST